MTVLKQAGSNCQTEIRCLTESRAREREKASRHDELVMGDHHREIRFLHEQTEEAEKATTKNEESIETVLS